MGRRLEVIAAGAVLGLLAGVLAPVVFVGACVWDNRMDWSALTKPELAPYIAVLVVLSTSNGAVGAWDGCRTGLCRVGPVAVAPGLLYLFPAMLLAQYPSSSKLWGVALLAVSIVAPFVWVAGRVGQEVGVRGRKRTPSQTLH